MLYHFKFEQLMLHHPSPTRLCFIIVRVLSLVMLRQGPGALARAVWAFVFHLDEFSGSMKITTHLDHISQCETACGTC